MIEHTIFSILMGYCLEEINFFQAYPEIFHFHFSVRKELFRHGPAMKVINRKKDYYKITHFSRQIYSACYWNWLLQCTIIFELFFFSFTGGQSPVNNRQISTALPCIASVTDSVWSSQSLVVLYLVPALRSRPLIRQFILRKMRPCALFLNRALLTLTSFSFDLFYGMHLGPRHSLVAVISLL